MRHTSPVSQHPEARVQQDIAELKRRLAILENPINTSAFLYRNGAQSFVTGSGKIDLDTAVSTPTALWETGKYIVPSTGLYVCLGQFTFQTTSVGATTFATIFVNGSEVRRGTRTAAAGGGIQAYVVCAFVQVKTGDHIELWANNQGAATAPLEIQPEKNNYLCVTKLG